MRAGRLRQRIIVEQPVRSQTSAGAEEVTWSLVAVVWADVMPIKGRERLAANQLLAGLDTMIRMRYAPIISAMDATWRLRLGDTIYNIGGPPVNVGMADREIEVLCTSGVNDG